MALPLHPSQGMLSTTGPLGLKSNLLKFLFILWIGACPLSALAAAESCGALFSPAATFYSKAENSINDRFLDAIKIELKKAETARDEHFVFLQEIGLQKDSSGNYTLDLNLAFSRIDSKIDSLITSGKLNKNQVLEPVRILVPKGMEKEFDETQFKLVKAGEPFPEGFVPFDGLVPSPIFYKLLSTGHFPVGIPSGLRTQDYRVKEGILFHDLNHISAMIKNPSYMAQVRSAATYMTGFKDNNSSESRSRFNRYEYFVEFFNSIAPAYRDTTRNLISEIRAALGVSQVSIISLKETNIARDYFNDISARLDRGDSYVLSKIDALLALTEASNFWTALGGGIRPIELRYGDSAQLHEIQHKGSLMMYDRPDLSLKTFLANPKKWAQSDTQISAARAAFLFEMERVIELNQNTVFEALFSNSEKATAELQRLCRAGVLRYPGICR